MNAFGRRPTWVIFLIGCGLGPRWLRRTREDAPQDPEPSTPTDSRAAPPASTSELDDQTLLDQLYTGAKQSLAEFINLDAKPLSCPGQYPGTFIAATAGSGALTNDVLACLRRDIGRKYVLVVRNQADVPPLRGKWITDIWTVKPNEVIEIDLATDLKFNQWLTFEPNLHAGIATAVTNYLEDKTQPGAKWKRCVDEGINAQCVADGLSDLLPSEVRIKDVEVPVRRIARGDACPDGVQAAGRRLAAAGGGTATGRLTITKRG